ncbi:hypothetical protein ACFQGW_13215 [Xanthomonas theicola]|uniref:hypothetical protein n=1 Tax=Xanthomonas theicola TaxID=56464 RepID=UPI003614A298
MSIAYGRRDLIAYTSRTEVKFITRSNQINECAFFDRLAADSVLSENVRHAVTGFSHESNRLFSSAAMSSSDAGVAHTDLSQSGFARSARLAWASIHSTTPAHRDLVNMSPAGSIFRGS